MRYGAARDGGMSPKERIERKRLASAASKARYKVALAGVIEVRVSLEDDTWRLQRAKGRKMNGE